MIPLTSVEHHFPIAIGAYPPFRQQLLIDRDNLSAALATCGATSDRQTWYFLRNEPEVTIAPQRPGELAELTAKPVTVNKAAKPLEPVAVDRPSGRIALRVTYTDEQTKNPVTAARHSSKEIRRALGRLPLVKYLHALDAEDRPILEMSNFAAQLLTAAASPAISAAISYAVNAISQSKEAPDLSLFIAISIPMGYALYGAAGLYDALEFRAGMMKRNNPRYELAAMVSEDLRTAFYPTKFVHELLVPSLLYGLAQIRGTELIVPLPPSRK